MLTTALTKTSQKANNQNRNGNGNNYNNGKNSNNSNRNNNGRSSRQHSDYIDPDKWAKMSKEEKKAVFEKRKNKKNNQSQQSNNNNSSNANHNNSHSNAQGNNQTRQNTNQTPPATTTNTTANTTSQSPAQRFIQQGQQSHPDIVVNGVTYCANVTHITYGNHQNQVNNYHKYSLIDRGANGGLSGDDVTVLSTSTADRADITGIAGKKVDNLQIVTAAGFIQTDRGPIIGIFHRYAHYGKGYTLHSPLQLEDFGHKVYDGNVISAPGTQRIVTMDGYVIPLEIREGLVFMNMRPPTYQEIDEYPHVIMTADENWDVTKL